MHYIFYKTPTFIDVVITLSSGSWHQTFFKTYSNKRGHKKSTHVCCRVNSTESYRFWLNYINVYNFNQNSVVKGKKYVFPWQKKDYTKWGHLVTATSPEFLGIPFHSHTHVLNTGNSIVPQIKMHSTTRQRGVGGWASSDTEKWAMRLKPYKQKTYYEIFSDASTYLRRSGLHNQKHRRFSSSGRIHHKAVGDEAGEEQKHKKGRRATAVALREGGNKNVTLASKCFVKVTVQTNSNLRASNYGSERCNPQRNSA
jgi:hypothetical protein